MLSENDKLKISVALLEGKEFRIKVTPKQSKDLQEYLFSLGKTWFEGDKKVQNEDIKYIFVGDNIRCSSFSFNPEREIKLELTSPENVVKGEKITHSEFLKELESGGQAFNGNWLYKIEDGRLVGWKDIWLNAGRGLGDFYNTECYLAKQQENFIKGEEIDAGKALDLLRSGKNVFISNMLCKAIGRKLLSLTGGEWEELDLTALWLYKFFIAKEE